VAKFFRDDKFSTTLTNGLSLGKIPSNFENPIVFECVIHLSFALSSSKFVWRFINLNVIYMLKVDLDSPIHF
jgi:hypothetical protein